MACRPATTEIPIAMPDSRQVDATHTFAGWPALEVAALRRGEGKRIASDTWNQAERNAEGGER
jgi:hypothetical protein